MVLRGGFWTLGRQVIPSFWDTQLNKVRLSPILGFTEKALHWSYTTRRTSRVVATCHMLRFERKPNSSPPSWCGSEGLDGGNGCTNENATLLFITIAIVEESDWQLILGSSLKRARYLISYTKICAQRIGDWISFWSYTMMPHHLAVFRIRGHWWNHALISK